MKIEDVRSQMQDEGCDSLSELDQMIEYEETTYQKFVSKGKERSEAGLKQKDRIDRLEQLRSTFIALSAPDDSEVCLIFDFLYYLIIYL